MNGKVRWMKWLLAAILAWACLHASQRTYAAPSKSRDIKISVTSKGFEPSPIVVHRGESLILKVTRTTNSTCARDFLVEGSAIKVALPLNQEVSIPYTPSKTGQIKFGCSMGMMVSGMLVVE